MSINKCKRIKQSIHLFGIPYFVHKVHIFWEGLKVLRNLHRRFDHYYIGQIYSGDFAKFCGLLRIYELYIVFWADNFFGVFKTEMLRSTDIIYLSILFCLQVVCISGRWIFDRRNFVFALFIVNLDRLIWHIIGTWNCRFSMTTINWNKVNVRFLKNIFSFRLT